MYQHVLQNHLFVGKRCFVLRFFGVSFYDIKNFEYDKQRQPLLHLCSSTDTFTYHHNTD